MMRSPIADQVLENIAMDLSDKCREDVMRDLKAAIDLVAGSGMNTNEFMAASILITLGGAAACGTMLSAILSSTDAITKKEASSQSFGYLLLSRLAEERDGDRAIKLARADMRARKVNLTKGETNG